MPFFVSKCPDIFGCFSANGGPLFAKNLGYPHNSIDRTSQLDADIIYATLLDLGSFGKINKHSIRNCRERLPKNDKFPLDYFSEVALLGEAPME